MMLPSRAASVLLPSISFLAFTSAANLAFNTPNFDDASGGGLPSVTDGSFVTISWWTLFDNTTLLVFQELKNGTYLYQVIASHFAKSDTEKVWTAGPIGQHSLEDSKFRFVLQNSGNNTCDGCALSGPTFKVEKKSGTIPSQTSSTSSAAGAISTSQASTATRSPQSATSGSIVGDSVKPKSAGDLDIKLGAGLGAGIPAALAIIAVFFLWLRHRRNKRRKETRPKDENDADHDDDDEEAAVAPIIGAGSKKTEMQERNSQLSHESGALGPYAENPSPTWEQQDTPEEAEQPRQVRKRASSKYAPFRPSLGAHSEASDEDSRHSWINEFDFEKPGYRNADEMSEARRSFHEYTPSQYSHASHASITDVADIPQVPQPVHQYPQAGDWPLRR